MNSIKYIIGTKDKSWFFMFHSTDITFLTKDPEKAMPIPEKDFYESNFPIENMFNFNCKFIDYHGDETDKKYEEIIGIDVKIEDCCFFKLETKIEYLLEQL